MPWHTILSGGVTAFSALMGAALGAFLAHRFNRNRDRLELKRDVLRRVVGYRWHLTPSTPNSDSPFFTALNEIVVVFAGDEDVQHELNRFRQRLNEEFRREHLRPLLEAMARSADVPHKWWSDDLIESPLSPPDRG